MDASENSSVITTEDEDGEFLTPDDADETALDSAVDAILKSALDAADPDTAPVKE